MSTKTFFLARAGQTYGPFSEGEIETLRESGEYGKYTWFWDQSRTQWQPIDPPPAPPVLVEKQAAPREIRQETRQEVRQPAHHDTHWISAVCYDQQTALTGTLTHVTEAGCEFATDSPATSPEFQEKIAVLLHLFDQKSGRSMNVAGRVGSAEIRSGRWVYRIHWKRCPQLISGETHGKDSSHAAVS